MKKLSSFFVLAFLLIFLLVTTIGCSKKSTKMVSYEDFEKTVTDEKGKDILVWYTDEDDEEYLKECADNFSKKYKINVEYKLVTKDNYLQQINTASVNDEGPDVYYLDNDNIEKAKNAGLASENELFDDSFWEKNFSPVSKQAVTCNDKQYGYPLYFSTFCLVYDSSLIQQAPATLENIFEFSETYEDQSNEKEIFKWDIEDPCVNYMFMGAYANIMGENGDDSSQFDVNNANCISSIEYYKTLHERLSFDATSASYDIIKDELSQGKLIFAVCKTDIYREFSNYPTSYVIAPLPGLNDSLNSKGLSTTKALVVNSFSENRAYANLFCAYMSYKNIGNQYECNGKVSPKIDSVTGDDTVDIIVEQYNNSISSPKDLSISEFWGYAEIMFSNIWQVNDVTSELNNLQDIMKSKLE